VNKVGQFFTPRHIAETAAYWLGVVINNHNLPPGALLDPTAGDGSLLRYATDFWQYFGSSQAIGLERPNHVPGDVEKTSGAYGVEIDASLPWKAEAKRIVGDIFDIESPRGAYIVANPPYLGGSKMSSALGSAYVKALKKRYPAEKAGSADLASYVFRYCMAELQPVASVWIATNTMAQGASRRVGFGWAVWNGFHPVVATREFEWPAAAVTCKISVWVRDDYLIDGVSKLIDCEVLEG
jgi:hypothetical protein